MQNKVLPIALDQISETLGTEVTASSIDLDFFEQVTLNDIKILDKEGSPIIQGQSITVDLSLFSLWNRTIMIDDIVLDGVTIRLTTKDDGSNYAHVIEHLTSKNEDTTTPSSSTKEPWKLGLDDIIITNSKVLIEDEYSSLDIDVGKIVGDFGRFPTADTVLLNQLIAENISMTQQQLAIDPSVSGETLFPSLPLWLNAKDVKISNGTLAIRKLESNSIAGRLDPSNLEITDLMLDAKDLIWSDRISVNINDLTAKERSQLQLEKLSGQLQLSNDTVSVDQLYIQTNESVIEGGVRSEYYSFDKLVSDFMAARTTINLTKAKISRKDIGKLVAIDEIKTINLGITNRLNYEGRIDIASNALSLLAQQMSIDNNLSASGKIKVALGESARYDLALTNINTTDQYLKKLLPTLTFPPELKTLGRLNGDLTMNGDASSINVQSVDLQLGDHTQVVGAGQITGLDTSEPRYNFNFDRLKTNGSDLFVKPSSLPAQIFRLGDISYSGTFAGSTTRFVPNGVLKSDLGDVAFDGEVQFNKEYSDATYSGNFDIDQFDLGTLLDDEKLGIATADGSISGQGLDFETISANADLKADRFDYDGQTYTDILIDGKYSDSSFTGLLKSDDEKLNLDFEGTADLNGENSVFQFDSSLEKLDLNQFGIGDSIMWVSGQVSGNFTGNTIDNIVGKGEIKSLKLGTRHGVYAADTTITFTSTSKDDGDKEYILRSELVDATVTGNIQVSQITDVVTAYIRDYIPIESGFENQAYEETVSDNQDQMFYLDVKAKNVTPMLDVLTDGKIKMKSGKLGGYFSAYDSEADIKGSLDSLFYDGYTIDNTDFFFDGRADFINGNLIAENISSDGKVIISEVYLSTIFNDNIAELILELYDADDNETLSLGADISRTDEVIVNFHDTLRINEIPWNFSKYNEVVYGADGLYMQDVKISKDDQAITMYTDENDNGQAIEVLLDNFRVSEVSSIINMDNEYLESRINGGLVVNSIWGKPFVTADLQLEDITVADNSIGRLTIEAVQNVETNSVTSNIALLGAENDATLKLNYSIASSKLDGKLDVKKLQMSAIDPLFPEVISNSEGVITGKLDVSGTVSKPSINGKFNLKDVITTPLFTNSEIRIEDQTISISNQRIALSSTKVLDDENNEAILSGGINHDHLSNFDFDLRLTTDRFKFLNTTPVENPLFYGKVTIAGEINVTGPSDKIAIDGTARAIDNSELSLSPFSSDNVDYSNDFIIYADPRKISIDSLNAKQLASSAGLPFDVEIRLSVAEDSKFEMIMNPLTGDKITGRGNANLILNLKSTGDIELYGTYIVTSGDYLFTFGAVNKVFDITPGSTVNFNGDPLQGILDVTAVYKTQAAVYDLIALEIDDGFDDNKKAEARRKRNFNVELDLSKSIIAPEIKMNITSTAGGLENTSDFSGLSSIIENKLQELRSDPDELNRQVFGLLIFDNFMLASNATTDLAETTTDIAIRSLSGLVTRELNQLASNLIKGVELDFNVNSYNSDLISSGQGGLVTEVGVGLQKNLFDDRLSIKIGSNIDLETSSSEAAVFNNIAGDFVVEYKILKDGSLIGRAFRKSNFDRIADENAFKNGISLFIRKKFGTINKKQEQ